MCINTLWSWYAHCDFFVYHESRLGETRLVINKEHLAQRRASTMLQIITSPWYNIVLKSQMVWVLVKALWSLALLGIKLGGGPLLATVLKLIPYSSWYCIKTLFLIESFRYVGHIQFSNSFLLQVNNIIIPSYNKVEQ